MKRKASDWALLGRVWAEVGAGHIDEGYIRDPNRAIHKLDTHGYIDGQQITINPVPDIVDSLLHEALHRLFPQWSEAYVTGRTTYLRRRMSDEEMQAMYAEYQKRAKKRKSPKVIDG